MTIKKQHQTSNVNTLNDELKIRSEKLDQIRQQGIAFPNHFKPDNRANQLHKKYGHQDPSIFTKKKIYVSVAGRIMMCRIMGKASFVSLQDGSDAIQLYVTRDDLPDGFYNDQFKKWDLGDIIGAKGYLFKTKTGELSLHCSELHLLTKALRPLPDKFHGLADQETRYRQRYLDLIANRSSRTIFIVRSKIIKEIRDFMDELNYIEVETPMTQIIPGGATAKPFTTHHNALNLDMYLRISPELYLKRLIIGGFERVYEINRNFRNEGISPRHNPEFTMMELYAAYSDYGDMMTLTETLFRRLALATTGSTIVQYGEHRFDFQDPFTKMTMKQAICHYHPSIHPSDLGDAKKITHIAQSLGINIEKSWGSGRIMTKIFEEVVESHLIKPTFITEYPTEVSPLARRNDHDPSITDRFEFFIAGHEIANGFSELNDAQDQAKRFTEQVRQKKAGDDEAMFYDEDYIVALEHGLPPTSGLGIGIDRAVMLFTNSRTIRDVILFPVLKPAKNRVII